MHRGLAAAIVAFALFSLFSVAANALEYQCVSNEENNSNTTSGRPAFIFIGYSVTRFSVSFIPDAVNFSLPTGITPCEKIFVTDANDEKKIVSPNLNDQDIGNDYALRYLIAMWIWNGERSRTPGEFNKLSAENLLNCYLHNAAFLRRCNSTYVVDRGLQQQCLIESEQKTRTCSVNAYFNSYRKITPYSRESLDEALINVVLQPNPAPYSPRIEKLLRDAAKAGLIAAQFALAQVLEDGIGVPINFVEAHAWRIVGATQIPKQADHIRDGYLFRFILSDEEKRQAQILADRYLHEYTNAWDRPSVTVIH